MDNVNEMELVNVNPEEVLLKTQNELLNYAIVKEDGTIDRSYCDLLKGYSDLYSSHEKATSEICKNNNEAVKIEYDNKYREDELKLKEREIENREKELELKAREIENRIEETELKHEDLEERKRQVEKEYKQRVREARKQLIIDIAKLVLGLGSTVTMIVMHERDKKYNDEDMLTNPEAKDHTKRMWNGILGLGKK